MRRGFRQRAPGADDAISMGDLGVQVRWAEWRSHLLVAAGCCADRKSIKHLVAGALPVRCCCNSN